jgi:hypothetical protein
MSSHGQAISAQRDVALVEVLDRALGAGVVITGDVTLSLADIDLVYLSLRLLVGSVGTINGELAENGDTELLALGGSRDDPA